MATPHGADDLRKEWAWQSVISQTSSQWLHPPNRLSNQSSEYTKNIFTYLWDTAGKKDAFRFQYT